MRSGSREYLLKPLDSEQLLQAVARVSGSRKQKKENGSGQVFAFIGAKGGSGVTTLVTQAGALLAKTQGKKALILDFILNLAMLRFTSVCGSFTIIPLNFSKILTVWMTNSCKASFYIIPVGSTSFLLPKEHSPTGSFPQELSPSYSISSEPNTTLSWLICHQD